MEKEERWTWEHSGFDVEVDEDAIYRRRSWRERLFTRPWRPWVAKTPTEFGAWMDRVIASGQQPTAKLYSGD